MVESVFISESYIVPANGWSSCPMDRVNVKEGSKSFFPSPAHFHWTRASILERFSVSVWTHVTTLLQRQAFSSLEATVVCTLSSYHGFRRSTEAILCACTASQWLSICPISSTDCSPTLSIFCGIFSPCGTCSHGNKASVPGGMD